MLSICSRPSVRWLMLGVILATEIIALTARFEVPSPEYYFVAKPDAAWLFELSKTYWQLVVWVIAACLLMLAPSYKRIYDELFSHSLGYRWHFWLTCHFAVLAAFTFITAYLFKQPADPVRLTTAWFSIWFALASSTFGLWLLALAPIKFWLQLISHRRILLLAGLILGYCAWSLIGMLIRQEAPLAQQELWAYLSGLTLQLVYALLGLVYSELVYEPESFIVGTRSFSGEITYACSGVEGISLIVVFLAVYLWLFRKDLRFPQVFWLFPVAMLAIWLANALRIALLIAIGSSISPEIASMGFHAQAGWIAFTLISIGAITLTHRLQFFSATHRLNLASGSGDNTLSAALLAPFLIQMATLMLTSAFSSDFDWLYPARIGIIAAVLYHYRKAYNKLFLSWDWQAPAIGVGVFIVWMLLEMNDGTGGSALSQHLDTLSNGSAIFWITFRTLGSAIIIPLAEELAFRGYLIRKLVAKDFENVPSSQFTWLSFILSSLLFGLLHDRWFVGTLAGMGYAMAVYRRGNLGDAIIAHMTTNALIAIFVLTLGRWSLWA